MQLQEMLVDALPGYVTRFADSVLRVLLSLHKSIEADIRWTVFYVLLLTITYLFHSPFRSHNGAALDGYARTTKVLQTWSVVTVVCFHVAPQIILEKQQQLRRYTKDSDSASSVMAALKGYTDDDAVSFAGIVFFPMFLSMTCLFLFLHKVKRRWGLAVTYGSSLTMVLMNSLLMAVLAIMHHTYSRRLFYYEEAVSPQVLISPFASKTSGIRKILSVVMGLYSFVLHRVVRHFIVTPSMAERPFEAMLRLEAICYLFIFCDYRYKRRQGGDPTRGILWADQYDFLKRSSYYEKQAEEGRKERGLLGWKLWWRSLLPVPAEVKASVEPTDWRDLEPKPRSFKKRAKKHGARDHDTAQDDVDSRQHHTHHSKTPAKSGPLLYNEAPLDVSIPRKARADASGAGSPSDDGRSGDLVRSASLASSGKTCGEDTASSTQGGHHLGRSILNDTASLVSANPLLPVQPSRLAKTTVSFHEKRRDIKEVAAGKHPEGKPGMVPWWSPFSIGTAWQGFVNTSFKFLSFDVRTIQEYATPKVFSLQFTPSLRDIPGYAEGNSADAASSTGWNMVPNLSMTSTRTSPAVDNTSVRDFPTIAPQTDVWFDWIADVGDGFNPTYEMARLMAQPFLQVNMTSSSRKQAVFGSNYLCGSFSNEDYACDIFTSGEGAGGSRKGTASGRRRRRLQDSLVGGRRRPSAPIGSTAAEPASFAGSDTQPLSLPPVNRVSRSQPTTPTTTCAPLPAGNAQSVGGDRSASAVLASEVSRGADPSMTPGALPLSGRTGDGSVGSTKMSDWRAAVNNDSITAATAPGCEILPRGSFVLVGGDLAYPLPTDETYSARLFDPYNDAFPGSHKLKKLFHAQQRNVVVPDPFNKDVVHITMLDAVSVAKMVAGGASTLGRHRNKDVNEDVQDASGSHGNSQVTTASDAEEGDALQGKQRVDVTTHDKNNTAPKTRRGGGGSKRAGGPVAEAKVTVAEALYSIPMLFSIPGNHDWFDGLSTFRKWIIEKTWMGGWLMPQRSSFFVLRLPHNWFILCMDTGNEQDINTSQRNYFLHAIETYMNEDSCVILTCHEPGWLFNAMEHRSSPLQPEVDAVVRQLGSRMRLRIAGDIHHYSRHIPRDPVSEAATLIVSGGGGAYLYGARDDRVIEQGTRYLRAAAFPRKNTYMSMASRLWGFRVVNWKFDIIIGVCCFGMIYSILPIPFTELDKLFIAHEEYRVAHQDAGQHASSEGVQEFSRFAFLLSSLTVRLWSYLMNNGIASFVPIGMFFACFHSAGADRRANPVLRLLYGGWWTAWCVLCCCGAVSMLYVTMQILQNNHMIASTATSWESFMEKELRASTDAFWTHMREVLGETCWVSLTIAAVQRYLYGRGQWIVQAVSIVVRALDPLDTLYYLSLRVAGDAGALGHFAADASRPLVAAYYAYVLFFYWIIVTPVVSLIIGLFLLVSATAFDFMYDGSYSAFQIEDFKHYLRFRIDHRTRQLHGYVIAEMKVPKVWTLNTAHAEEMAKGERRALPPHLRFHPSRWIPSLTKKERAKQHAPPQGNQRPATADVLEHFIIQPHRTATSAAAGSGPTEPVTEPSSAKLPL